VGRKCFHLAGRIDHAVINRNALRQEKRRKKRIRYQGSFQHFEHKFLRVLIRFSNWNPIQNLHRDIIIFNHDGLSPKTDRQWPVYLFEMG